MMAGCILHDGISRIEGCPRIRDVEDMVVLLAALGCRVWWEGSCLTVDASDVNGWKLPREAASRMRSSVLFLGALLGRMGKAERPYPGGCVLGSRPVDLHIQAMRAMGAQIGEEKDCLMASASSLNGCEFCLRFPSVGATENLLLAAVTASGKTVIHNAAREPEIEQLCLFLTEKGARIRQKRAGTIEVEGVKRLHDSLHHLMPDRIVAGTYLIGAAVTGGRIELERFPAEHMQAVTETLAATGISLQWTKDRLMADCRGERKGIDFLETAPYPGFPTDLQSPMVTLLSVSEGCCRVRENIFESRFKTVSQLQKMGAKIISDGKDILIEGTGQLHGAEVCAEELRGAAALFLAGLNASGRTRIRGCCYAERGYENICNDFRKLGAEIQIIE